MKIETVVKSHHGQPVKYSNNIRVIYDNKGIAEVSSEDGKYLIEKYEGQIFTAGKVVLPEKSAVISKTSDNSEISELKEQLQRANKIANDCKIQAQAAKDGEATWRTKCEELLVEIESLKAQIPEPKPRVLTPEEELAELKKQLEAKTTKELVAFAEEAKFPEDEYKKLNKTLLIEYLISKTTNANS